MFKNIDIMSKINSRKIMYAGGAALLAIILCIFSAVKASANKAAEKEIKTYDYNAAEQALAEEVKAYLAQYMELPEQTSNEIADAAVQKYNIVMSSDTDVINDEITNAVRKQIRGTIFLLLDNPEAVNDETLDALSSGITEIIWNAILSQLQLQLPQSDPAEYREEYEYLIQSLQKQINDLKERKTKVSINANITDNTDTDITSDDILAGMENMSEEELLALAEKLGLSIDQLMELMEASIAKSDKDMSDLFDGKMKEEIENLRRELKKEISSMTSNETGTGKMGAKGEKGDKGEKGENGAAGRDGNDGSDGKTTYIAYADDAHGSNFSLTPTETSKYVGTCITPETQQPTAPARYGNWQEYRAYIITSTTDPDTGVTTVHIN